MMGYGVGSVAELLEVIGLTIGDDLGEAVGCHEDGDIIALRLGDRIQGLGHTTGEGVDEGREGVPCPGYSHRQTWGDGLSCFVEGAMVAAHDVGGVLGGEDEADDLGRTFVDKLLESFVDKGGCMAHAHTDLERGAIGVLGLKQGLEGEGLGPGVADQKGTTC